MPSWPSLYGSPPVRNSKKYLTHVLMQIERTAKTYWYGVETYPMRMLWRIKVGTLLRTLPHLHSINDTVISETSMILFQTLDTLDTERDRVQSLSMGPEQKAYFWTRTSTRPCRVSSNLALRFSQLTCRFNSFASFAERAPTRFTYQCISQSHWKHSQNHLSIWKLRENPTIHIWSPFRNTIEHMGGTCQGFHTLNTSIDNWRRNKGDTSAFSNYFLLSYPPPSSSPREGWWEATLQRMDISGVVKFRERNAVVPSGMILTWITHFSLPPQLNHIVSLIRSWS